MEKIEDKVKEEKIVVLNNREYTKILSNNGGIIYKLNEKSEDTPIYYFS